MNTINRVVLLFLFALPLYSCMQRDNSITIRGSVEFPRDGESIKIIYQDGFSQTVVDSIPMNADNTFEKRVTLSKPGRYMLSGHTQYLYFWGENEDIEVKMRGRDTAKMIMIMPTHIQILNSGPNNELMNLISYYSYLVNTNMYSVANEMYRAQQSGEKEWIKYISDGYDKNREYAKGLFDYLGKYYKDRNSAIILTSMTSPEVKEDILAYFKTNKPDYTPYVEYIEAEAYKVEQKQKLSLGNVAPDFSYPTEDGQKQLGPKDFRGQYLIVDFWASWCGPCRKSIPHLKELYEKYHDMGLEILSVSIDKDEKAWRKAMGEEKMPWPQILAPESGKDVQKIYQFSGIPHVLVLDKDGKILAREIYGDDVGKEVSKIFNKK